jgi:hypothetical protein
MSPTLTEEDEPDVIPPELPLLPVVPEVPEPLWDEVPFVLRTTRKPMLLLQAL